MINNDTGPTPADSLIARFIKGAFHALADSISTGKVIAVMGMTDPDNDGHSGTWGLLASLAMGPLYLSRYGDDDSDSGALDRLLQKSHTGTKPVPVANKNLADELTKYVTQRVATSVVSVIITVDVAELLRGSKGVTSSSYTMVKADDGHELVTQHDDATVIPGHSRKETEDIIFELTQLAVGSMAHDVRLIDEYMRREDVTEEYTRGAAENGKGGVNTNASAPVPGIPSPSIN